MKKLPIKVPACIVASLFIMQTHTASQKTPVINNNSSTVSKAVTRAKNILSQHKDEFQKIEYTFLWEADGWISNLIFALIIGVPCVICAIVVALLPFVYLKEQSYLSDNQFNAIAVGIAIILGVLGFIGLGWWGYEWYQDSQNPGYIVLTDTALLSIPPGKDSKYVWFSYKDMLIVQEKTKIEVHGSATISSSYLQVTPRINSACSVWTFKEEDINSEYYQFLKAYLHTKVHG